MATYLQGVTDYIPQIQPFKPDLNFYQGVLETKQAQYKAGYDQLSNIYGTMLNSELSRADNTERRDQFFNKIQTDIQKISGLDLSRSENVDAAQKVFQPIIDDNYILKDMSFTKSYRREQGKADYFLNCTDPKKCGGKYWEGGVRALDYQRQDFMEAGLEQSLGYQNPTYTPYVNVDQMAQNFAKEMGYKVKTVNLTPDGLYQITTTNGPQMVTGLTDAFVGAFANDPSVNAMYKTQAYLQRKDYVSSNAERFGGDKMAAEKEYLVTEAKKVNEYMRTLKVKAEKDKEKVAVTKKATAESAEKTPISPDLDQGFANLINGLDADEKNANAVATVATESLDATNGIDYENMSIEALRYRIDIGQANQMLYMDLGKAAEAYAMNTMEEELTEDKYALAKFEHGLRMSEIGYEASLKEAAKKKEKEEEEALSAEYQLNTEGVAVDTGDDTGMTDMKKLVDNIENTAFSNVAGLTGEKAALVYEQLKAVANSSGATEAQKALARTSMQDIFGALGSTPEQIEEVLAANRSNDIFTGLRQLTFGYNNDAINSKIDVFLESGGSGLFREESRFINTIQGLDGRISTAKLKTLAISEGVRKNNQAVRQQMYADGGDDIDLFFKEDGTKRSFGDFKKLYNERHPNKAALRSAWNPIGNAMLYPFVDSAEDTYDDLEEQYKKTYNGGKVKIVTPYEALDKVGASGLHAKATLFTMDPSVLGGMRSKTKELYEKDIAPAMYDPASSNARFFTGAIVGKDADDFEDLEIDSDDSKLAQKMINDIMRAAFTNKWKDDKAERPTMDIVRHGIVGGDPNKVGVTFTINQNYIDGFKGSAKEKGLLNSMFGAEGTNQISVVMDKKATNSQFFQEIEPTDVEYVFNTMGSLNIDAYANSGGTATITKTGTGYISVTGDLKSYNPQTKRLESIPLPWADVFPDDADVNVIYDSVHDLISAQSLENSTYIRNGIK